MMKIAWRSTKKHKKHSKKKQNTYSFLGAIWSTTDTKTVQKRSFFPTHCFYTSPGICRRFPTSGPVPNTPKGTFLPEVPFQRSSAGSRKSYQPVNFLSEPGEFHLLSHLRPQAPRWTVPFRKPFKHECRPLSPKNISCGTQTNNMGHEVLSKNPCWCLHHKRMPKKL